MLKSLSIKNFQSHLFTTLDFSSGLNIIVGSSNSGKSAILRSIYWLLTNRPSGTSFIHHGEDECHVVIETIDGHVVERKRTKSFNGYIVDNEVLEAIRTDVPQQVYDILNITDINIQRQFDSFFLLQDSPGKVASTINNITNLEQGEAVVSLLNSRVRKNNTILRDAEIEIETYNDTLKKYVIVSDIKIHVEKALNITEKVEELCLNILDLTNLNNNLSVIERELAFLPDIIKAEELSASIQFKCRKCEILKDDSKNIAYLKTYIGKIDAIILFLPDVDIVGIKTLHIQFDALITVIDILHGVVIGLQKIILSEEQLQIPVEIDSLEYVNIIGEMNNLRVLLSNILDNDEELKNVVMDFNELIKMYNSLLKTIDFCPMCKQKLTEEGRKQVLKLC